MAKKFIFVAMAATIVVIAASLLLVERLPQRQDSKIPPEVKLKTLISSDVLPTEVTLGIDNETTTYCFESDTQQFTAKGYDPRLSFDQNKLEKLFVSMCELSSRSTVEEQPTGLARYGLDKPVATVTATYADGTCHVVRIGNRSPLEDGYYGMVDDQPEVQLLLSYDVDSFQTKLHDYRVPELLPLLNFEENEYVVELLELEMNRKTTGELRLHRDPPQPNAEVALAEPLWITVPVQVEADQYLFTDLVVKGLFALMRTTPTIVEDLPQDLVMYGLDKPDLLHLRDSEIDVTLYIGKGNNEQVYIMREDIPSVLSINRSLINFFNISYEEIMSRLIWIHNIKDIATLRIVTDGTTYNLDTTGATEGTFLLDAREVAEDAARALFAAALSAKVEQRLATDQQPGAKECELVMVYKDGTEHLLTFFALNERQMAFSLADKEPEFYCTRQQVNAIVEALKALQQS